MAISCGKDTEFPFGSFLHLSIKSILPYGSGGRIQQPVYPPPAKNTMRSLIGLHKVFRYRRRGKAKKRFDIAPAVSGDFPISGSILVSCDVFFGVFPNAFFDVFSAAGYIFCTK